MSTISYRPCTGEAVAAVDDSTPADVDAAVARARAAVPALATAAPARRRAWLERLADVLDEHTEELAALADEETALGMPRLRSEAARMASQLRFYGAVAAEGSYLGVTVDDASVLSTGTPAPRMVRVNQPLGPVAVFGASNFPFGFGVLGNDTASALAAGCPVIAKAHPAHVRLCVRLAELADAALTDAGAPPGAFGLVLGLDSGTRLVRDAGIAAVGFTGSQAGGLALWRLANERPVVIPVYAEMGTVNPVVVTPGAAATGMDTIAAGFVDSFTLGAGQFCTKPGLLLAPAGQGAPAAVAAALGKASPPLTMLTQGIAAAAATGVAALLDAGAAVLGRIPGPADGWAADAVALSAPIGALTEGSRLLEECFAPVALVVEYHGPEDLADALDALQGSLTGTVITDGTPTDPHAATLIDRLSDQVGRVTVDDWPTGAAWTWAQQHGGPWPATSAPSTTSVGAAALDRWTRPVTYQSTPDAWLPPAGRKTNPWGVPQRINGLRTDGSPTE
ncbi:aldehyde dehydrogenase family protein [Streptomyces phaeolivaceus]|uniref:Aldehyde dehydrogenase family protein n=1 Tax=Streptomyces phaeolivaceus TaxID=2653200 RepID=A0A5P8KFW9_9ACTN|nr:aldehyde dehydrogenase family protein [Streptomyces phaeolivaceus]QFR01659.1 aldehyde dehydrogenase family protein [Streptomyces phaeolivaceus]